MGTVFSQDCTQYSDVNQYLSILRDVASKIITKDERQIENLIDDINIKIKSNLFFLAFYFLKFVLFFFCKCITDSWWEIGG
jgi:hypothetical protein